MGDIHGQRSNWIITVFVRLRKFVGGFSIILRSDIWMLEKFYIIGLIYGVSFGNQMLSISPLFMSFIGFIFYLWTLYCHVRN